MKYLKKLGRSYMYIMAIVIIGSFVITLLSYFNIISDKTCNLLLTLICSISLIIGGYQLGIDSKNKGWVEGLKLGIITISLLLIISIIVLNYHYSFSSFIYFIIITASCILGSIIGKNKSIKNK